MHTWNHESGKMDALKNSTSFLKKHPFFMGIVGLVIIATFVVITQWWWLASFYYAIGILVGTWATQDKANKDVAAAKERENYYKDEWYDLNETRKADQHELQQLVARVDRYQKMYGPAIAETMEQLRQNAQGSAPIPSFKEVQETDRRPPPHIEDPTMFEALNKDIHTVGIPSCKCSLCENERERVKGLPNSAKIYDQVMAEHAATAAEYFKTARMNSDERRNYLANRTQEQLAATSGIRIMSDKERAARANGTYNDHPKSFWIPGQ
jgi:ferredoxin-thioredoxin reductase catalytic subunit